MFLDHQTLAKVYFKRRTNQSIKANLNYDNDASTYGLWDGVGVSDAYDYQLLICGTSFYSGFFVSGYTNCSKQCDGWCDDKVSPYFRTAATWSDFSGVAFNTNGHQTVTKRLISVGLRWDIYGLSCVHNFPLKRVIFKREHNILIVSRLVPIMHGNFWALFCVWGNFVVLKISRNYCLIV